MRSCLLQNPFSSFHIHVHVLCVKIDLSLSLGTNLLNEPPGNAGILKANVTNPNKFSLQTVKLCNNMKGVLGRVRDTFLVSLLKLNVLTIVCSFRERAGHLHFCCHLAWAFLKTWTLPTPKPEKESLKIDWLHSFKRLLIPP